MRHISVVTQKSIGKIKKLNGGNLAPPLSSEKAGISTLLVSDGPQDVKNIIRNFDV